AHGFCFCLGVGHYPGDVTLGEYAKAVRGHHREKELVHLGKRQGGTGYDRNLSLYPWIDNESLAAQLADLVDEGAYICILQVDRPAVLAGSTWLETRFGCE